MSQRKIAEYRDTWSKTSAGMKHGGVASGSPRTSRGRKKSLATGMFLFAGYLLFKPPSDSFSEYQLMLWCTFASPSTCWQQQRTCTWGRWKERRGCRLSFWEPVEGMEDGKDEDMVQPPKGTHSTLVNPGVRDDWTDGRRAKQRHLSSESLWPHHGTAGADHSRARVDFPRLPDRTEDLCKPQSAPGQWGTVIPTLHPGKCK